MLICTAQDVGLSDVTGTLCVTKLAYVQPIDLIIVINKTNIILIFCLGFNLYDYILLFILFYYFCGAVGQDLTVNEIIVGSIPTRELSIFCL